MAALAVEGEERYGGKKGKRKRKDGDGSGILKN